MHPILFEIPGLGFPIRSFGVLVCLGFILGSWILNALVKRWSRDPARDVERFASLPVWILIGVVAGARLLYVIVEVSKGSEVGQQYLDQPWMIFAIWEGGLVMYGGLFGGMIGGTLCAWKRGIAVPPAMDLGLVGGFFGYAVGRVGCLLVGDDYGSIVPERFRDLPFPLVVRVPDVLPEGSLFGSENAGQVLWGTQMWMCANGLLLCLIGWLLLKHRKYAGQVSLILIAAYAVNRSIIELFRGDLVRGVWFDGALSTSQMISIVAGGSALVLLVLVRGRRGELHVS